MLIKNILAVVLIGIYLIFYKPINREIRLKWNYTYGLIGEQSVGKILEGLPESYKIFANVVIPPLKSNIDFVVIGPTGIYTIEVKSHNGFITEDGHQLLRNGIPFQEGDILHQAYGESMRLSDYLLKNNIASPEIQPFMVFSNKYTTMHFGKKQLHGVSVIGAKWLTDTIYNRVPLPIMTVDNINKIQKVFEEIIK